MTEGRILFITFWSILTAVVVIAVVALGMAVAGAYSGHPKATVAVFIALATIVFLVWRVDVYIERVTDARAARAEKERTP